MLGILARLAHEAAVLGNDEAAQAMIQAWKDFIETMATAIASTCSQAPITPQMAYGLSHRRIARPGRCDGES